MSSLLPLVLIVFSWASLAAYVGLAAFLIGRQDVPGRGAFRFTAIVILVPTACFLYDQNSYQWLDQFRWIDTENARDFSTGSFVLNVLFFCGIALSWFTCFRFPVAFRISARQVCFCAGVAATPWATAGLARSGSLFLPLLFVPNAELLTSRLLFVVCFFLISAGVYCLFSASVETEQK